MAVKKGYVKSVRDCSEKPFFYLQWGMPLANKKKLVTRLDGEAGIKPDPRFPFRGQGAWDTPKAKKKQLIFSNAW